MTERRQLVQKISRRFEDMWRVVTNTQNYTEDEVDQAVKFLQEQASNYKTGVEIGGVDGMTPEELADIFAGINHYPNFVIPPELKYKKNQN